MIAQQIPLTGPTRSASRRNACGGDHKLSALAHAFCATTTTRRNPHGDDRQGCLSSDKSRPDVTHRGPWSRFFDRWCSYRLAMPPATLCRSGDNLPRRLMTGFVATWHEILLRSPCFFRTCAQPFSHDGMWITRSGTVLKCRTGLANARAMTRHFHQFP